MNLRYVWPVVALSAGCAVGAPLDSEGTGSTLPATSSATNTGSTDPGTSTGEATTEGSTTVMETGDSSGSSSTGGEPADGGEYYPFEQVHSPITPAVAESIAAIAGADAGKKNDVFMKAGGSSTASANFLSCLATPMAIVELPPALMPTVTFFNQTVVDVDKTSFNRPSLAAVDGQTAAASVMGMPAPLQAEAEAINPRYAVVLFGTHELEAAQPDGLFAFADDLLAVVDALIEGGTVPILSTLPPRTVPMGIEAQVVPHNAVVRAIAQGRKIPLVDLHFALSMLPNQGLAADGIDLSVALDVNMAPAPCSFDMASSGNGYNQRNLVTLEALERARQIVAEEAAPPDPPGPLLMGAGSLDSPFQIPGLPFVDLRSTADSVSDAIDTYAGTCVGAEESGPEYIYELKIDAATGIRAMVFDRGGVDVDVHLLTLPDSKTCVKRDDRLLQGPLQPGTYYLAVDTIGAAVPGEFAFVVLPGG